MYLLAAMSTQLPVYPATAVVPGRTDILSSNDELRATSVN